VHLSVSSPQTWVVGIVVASLFSVGCGQGQGTVTGTVKFQDKPLAFGSVVIRGPDGIPRTAHISPGGTYTMPDIPCGAAKLAVYCPDPAEQDDLLEQEKAKFQKGLAKTLDRKVLDIDRTKWFAIPSEYGDFDKSGLFFEVKKGSNTFDIILK
jgi:hypothetical protein